MTITAMYTLEDAFQQASLATNHGRTQECISWLQMYCRNVIDQNQLTIEREGLGNLFRAWRKKKEPNRHGTANVHQICLDLGLPDLDLDSEISVPEDMERVIYGPSRWMETGDDATAEDVEKHAVFLQATGEANIAKAADYRLLYQVMVRAGRGQTNIPMRKLRQMAKGEQN